jgi:Phage tail tube protein
VPFTNNAMNVDPGLFSPVTIVGTRDLQVYPLYGQEKDLGAIDGPLFPTNGTEMLVYAIGSDVVSGASPGPYTHTITQTNTLPSMTIEKNLGGYQSIQFAGCRVNKFGIKGAATDTEAAFTCDIVAQSFAILNSPSAITLVDETPFVFAEFTLDWNGFQISEATNFSIEIDNGVKASYTFNGSHEAQFVTPTHIKVSGSFDVVWDSLNDAQRGYFNQAVTLQTQAALSFTLTHPASGGSIAFTLPRVHLGKPTIDPKMSEVIMQTIPFEAFKNVGGSPATTIGCTIVNSRSTAY